ncbi:MAG: SpoVA/SpoVAEb family sporulation membrane protein, partial [Clostridiales bacterium]|nr:SpoVA/SpoVAEb family sporulation membrane protein [Clostridiales bacterium]
MTVSKQEYKKMAGKASPGSPYLKNALMAFLFGGAICTGGQILADWYMRAGLAEKDAKAWVSISLIALSAILTALKVYDNIAKLAGAGTLVPITGFANSVVAPAMEFKSEGFIMGLGAKMFVIAGPVLVYGTA